MRTSGQIRLDVVLFLNNGVVDIKKGTLNLNLRNFLCSLRVMILASNKN